jgi:hypothetical protein
MVQTSLPFAPPSNANLPLSKCFNTSSDAQDLVKAIKDVEIASGRAPTCICSYTAPEDASEATPTEPCSPAPSRVFPENQTLAKIVTSEHVQQFLDILQSFSTQQGPPPKSPGAKPGAPEGAQPKIAPASKLEFKTVNEVYVPNGNQTLADNPSRWNEKDSEYKIQEPSTAKVNTLDDYVFVMRTRIGKWDYL